MGLLSLGVDSGFASWCHGALGASFAALNTVDNITSDLDVVVLEIKISK